MNLYTDIMQSLDLRKMFCCKRSQIVDQVVLFLFGHYFYFYTVTLTLWLKLKLLLFFFYSKSQ